MTAGIPTGTALLTLGGGNARDPYAPTALDQQRADAIAKAAAAYEGVYQGGDPQWPLLWTPGEEANPNIIINRCGPAVDTDVAWLMGESVGITLVNGDMDADDPGDVPDEAQDYVNAAWGSGTEDSSDDDKMTLLQRLATTGAYAGDAFIKILWDTADSSQEYPGLVVLDPAQVRVQTDPQNVDVVRCYIIEYSQGGQRGTFRQVIERTDPDGYTSATGRPDKDTTWSITNYTRREGGTAWEQQGAPVEWPYTWAPVDHCHHLVKPTSPYGRPRLTANVIHVNEAICKVESNINLIGQRHAAPVMYTVKPGAKEPPIKHKPGTILIVSSDIHAVEAPGDIAGLRLHRADLDMDFEEATHIPAQAYGRTDASKRSGAVSGVGIRLDFAALVSDIVKERRTYGALISRVTQHMLELKNAAWATFVVNLTWPDAIPTDLLQSAQVAQIAVNLGVMSKETAAKQLKLNWDTEQQNMQDEQQDAQSAMAQGLAPQTPPAFDPSLQQQPGQPGAAPSAQPTAPATGNGGTMPPTNHPAAIQARATMSAAFGGGQG